MDTTRYQPVKPMCHCGHLREDHFAPSKLSPPTRCRHWDCKCKEYKTNLQQMRTAVKNIMDNLRKGVR